MNQYKVVIRARREKVFLIKLIRDITCNGLKWSKDFIEAQFTFDEWLSDTAEFKITVTAEQLGHIAHFMMQDHNVGRINIISTKITSPDVDYFNFTQHNGDL